MNSNVHDLLVQSTKVLLMDGWSQFVAFSQAASPVAVYGEEENWIGIFLSLKMPIYQWKHEKISFSSVLAPPLLANFVLID